MSGRGKKFIGAKSSLTTQLAWGQARLYSYHGASLGYFRFCPETNKVDKNSHSEL